MGCAPLSSKPGSGSKPNDRIEEWLLESSPAITAKAKTSSRTARLPMANRSISATIAAGKAARTSTHHLRPHSRATFAQLVLSHLKSGSGMARFLASHHLYAIDISLRLRVRFFTHVYFLV